MWYTQHLCTRSSRGEDDSTVCDIESQTWTKRCDSLGLLCWIRVGDLYSVSLNQNGDHSILQHHAIPSGMCLVGPRFILHQDNDPKHKSKLCQSYLRKKNMMVSLKTQSSQQSVRTPSCWLKTTWTEVWKPSNLYMPHIYGNFCNRLRKNFLKNIWSLLRKKMPWDGSTFISAKGESKI